MAKSSASGFLYIAGGSDGFVLGACRNLKKRVGLLAGAVPELLIIYRCVDRAAALERAQAELAPYAKGAVIVAPTAVAEAIARRASGALLPLVHSDKSSSRPSISRGYRRRQIPETPMFPALTHIAPAIDPADVAGSFAKNTRRAYAADWRDFTAWCQARGFQALPASPGTVALYLKDLAPAHKMSTVRRRLAGIAKVHRIAGTPLDRRDPALSFALERLSREHGTAPEGKAELMLDDIKAMLDVAGEDLLGRRDRALLLLTFATGARRSEIAALAVADLELRRDGLAVHIRRSKTDQHGHGRRPIVAYGKHERTCPVRALKLWLETSRITEGPVFRALRGRTLGPQLSGHAIAQVVKRLARGAGIDASKIGAHSLRAGHVTQARANGAELARIQEQLGHTRVETTLRYDRRQADFKTTSSGKLGL